MSPGLTAMNDRAAAAGPFAKAAGLLQDLAVIRPDRQARRASRRGQRRRAAVPPSGAAAPDTSASSTILGDGAAWICYPDIGIADLIPVPRLSR